MFNKLVAFLLTCVFMMFSSSPLKVCAQTRIEGNVVNGEQSLKRSQVKLNPDLKTLFTQEIAKTKSAALTEADFKRFEKERFFPKTNGQSKKKDQTKLALVLVGVAITVGVILLVKYGSDNPTPFCSDVTSAPNCTP